MARRPIDTSVVMKERDLYPTAEERRNGKNGGQTRPGHCNGKNKAGGNGRGGKN